jgi:DNA-binding NarL/FixJ family response regulator
VSSVPATEAVGERYARKAVAVLRRTCCSADVANTDQLYSRADDLAAAEEVVAGKMSGLVLTGAAGIGKTRLAREVARMAAARDVAVAWVQATATSNEIPFGAMAPFLPPLVSPFDVLPMLVAARRAIADLAAGRRLLLIVDDAPLLDEPSALVIAQAVATADAVMLATQRAGSPLPEPIARLRLPRRELVPLGFEAASAIIEELAGGRVARVTRVHLHRLSGGNPMYLHELVLAGHEAKAWRQDADGLTLDKRVGAAARLTELVSVRFDGLRDDAADAVNLLALGEPLGMPTVEGLTSPEAVEILDEAGVIDVIVDGRRTSLRLAHPIYAEVLRGRMSVLRRRRLYGQLAARLTSHGARRRDDLMRLATWYLEAGDEPPADLLAAAGHAARQAGDEALAERFLKASMATAPTFAAGRLLADTIYRQGRSPEVDEILTTVEALELSPAERTACAMTRAVDAYWNAGDAERTEAHFEAALQLAPTSQERLAVTALRASLLAASRRYVEAAGLIPQCLGGPPSRHHIDAALAAAWAYPALGRGEEAIAVLDGVLDAYASAIGQEASVMTMQVLLSAKSGALVELGRLDEADDCVAVTIEAAEATGERAAIAFAELSRGSSQMRRGRYREATRAYVEAEALIRAMNRPSMLRWALIGRVFAEASSGDIDAARRDRAELDVLGTHPASVFDGVLRRADAALLRADGRLPEARVLLEEAATEAASLGDCATEAACLHDLVRFGRPHPARARLAELAASMDGRWLTAFSVHASAMATDDAELLGEASKRFEEIGALAFAVEAAQEAADAFARAGDQRAAARSARRAIELAERVDTMGRPSATGLGGADPLTSREREVAELAAEGLSSKAIGQRLFVSTRTVESHLLRIYAKLGVRSRAELAELLSAGSG